MVELWPGRSSFEARAFPRCELVGSAGSNSNNTRAYNCNRSLSKIKEGASEGFLAEGISTAEESLKRHKQHKR